MRAKKNNRFARRVYRVIHPEFKVISQGVTGNAGIYDSGQYYKCLNIVTVGNDNSTRVGNKITIKSIKIRLQISQNAENTSAYNIYRAMVVRNKFPDNSGICNIAEVLDFDLSGGNHMNAFRNLDFYKNYKVLKDTYARYIGDTGNYVPSHTWNWYIKQNVVPTYNATVGVAADISLNSYWVIVYADQGANYPDVQLDYSVRYIDC